MSHSQGVASSSRDEMSYSGTFAETKRCGQSKFSLFHCLLMSSLNKLCLRPPRQLEWNKMNSRPKQCDQIWRNLTTLALCCETLVILKRFIYNLAKLWTHFGIFFIVLGKWAVLQMAKFWTHKLTIWSHCSLVLFLSPHSHPVYCFAVANAHGPSH